MSEPTVLQQFQIPLLYLNNILALSLKPGPVRILLTLPTLLLLVAQSALRTDFQYWGEEYPLNVLVIASAFVWVDWIFLASPDKEAWHKIQYGKGPEFKVQKKENSKVPASMLGRIWWGMRLATTNRYTGWSNQVKNVPTEVPANYPRWLFVLRKTLRTVLMWFITGAVTCYTVSTPHGAWRGMEHEKVLVGLHDISMGRKFVLTWAHIVITYGSLEMFNAAYGAVAVLSGLANPRDCPSSFGDLRGMYTVRKAWGEVWHQMMRRICSAPATVLARDVFHLRKGTFASKYLQLFVSFAISAIAHGGASMLATRSMQDDQAFAAFMAQAIAILLEDHVIELGRHLGFRDSPMWRLIGYVWTIVWIGTSMVPYTGSMIDREIWIHDGIMYPDLFGMTFKS
ncbi:hypothetical protein EJ04DRAFT_111521 [Polyplosphaeria fusca]|uniref:Wax synthase domain-containing protein n=1 Tax=Polyplosphaeria fusca TaxID=682080 RepID=A0A9P4RCB1_9PLEO|nr:hypothetical protein EJ04DRAFT_111521 [Polyplosphaeria fusca]